MVALIKECRASNSLDLLQSKYSSVRFSHLTTVDRLNKAGNLALLYIPGHVTGDRIMEICRLSQHPQSKYTYKRKGCGLELVASKFDNPLILAKSPVFAFKKPKRQVQRRFAYWKHVKIAA